jgi:hypothetical protein
LYVLLGAKICSVGAAGLIWAEVLALAVTVLPKLVMVTWIGYVPTAA